MKLYEDYVKGQSENTEPLLWINTVLKNYAKKHSLDQTEVEHILDYLMSDRAPKRQRKMSYVEAKRGAEKWNSALQKKGKDIEELEGEDYETAFSCQAGGSFVKLISKKALEREGFLMRHCVGGYNPHDNNYTIYSYRDGSNSPHCTIQVMRQGGELAQIKGKGNGAIHPRYIGPVMEFLEHIGQKVRPSEMANLGYMHVPRSSIDMVSQVEGLFESLTEIKGELYIYDAA